MKNKKRVWQIILKLPLQILIFATWIASFYAAAVKLQGVTWGTPVVFTIILGCYVWGKFLDNKN